MEAKTAPLGVKAPTKVNNKKETRKVVEEIDPEEEMRLFMEEERKAEEAKEAKRKAIQEKIAKKKQNEEEEAEQKRIKELEEEFDGKELEEIVKRFRELEKENEALKKQLEVGGGSASRAPAEKPEVIRCGVACMKKPSEVEDGLDWGELNYAPLKRCGCKASHLVEYEGIKYNVCSKHYERGSKGYGCMKDGVVNEPRDGFYVTANEEIAPLYMTAHYKTKVSKAIVKKQMEYYPERYAWLGVGNDVSKMYKAWLTVGIEKELC